MATFSKIALIALLAMGSVQAAPIDSNSHRTISSAVSGPTSVKDSKTIKFTPTGNNKDVSIPGLNWGHLGLHGAPKAEHLHVESKKASAHVAVSKERSVVVITQLQKNLDADKKAQADDKKLEQKLHDKDAKLAADEKATENKLHDVNKHFVPIVQKALDDHMKTPGHLVLGPIPGGNEQVVKEVYEKLEKDKKGDSKKEDSKKGDSKKEDSKKGDSKKEDSKKGDSKKDDTKKGDSKKEDPKKDDKKNKGSTSAGHHSHTIIKGSNEYKKIMTSSARGKILSQIKGHPEVESIEVSTTVTKDTKVASDGSYYLTFSYVKVTKITETSGPDNEPATTNNNKSGNTDKKHTKF